MCPDEARRAHGSETPTICPLTPGPPIRALVGPDANGFLPQKGSHPPRPGILAPRVTPQ